MAQWCTSVICGLNSQGSSLCFVSSCTFFSRTNFVYHHRSVAENKDFRSQRLFNAEEPFMFCQLHVKEDEVGQVWKWHFLCRFYKLLTKVVSCLKVHYCPPTFASAVMPDRGQLQRYLLRADCSGKLSLWCVPEVSAKEIAQIKQERFDLAPGLSQWSRFSPHFHVHVCHTTFTRSRPLNYSKKRHFPQIFAAWRLWIWSLLIFLLKSCCRAQEQSLRHRRVYKALGTRRSRLHPAF